MRRPAQVHWLVLATTVALLATHAAGCAPKFSRVAVPTGDRINADSWATARPGAGIELTTRDGARYSGTIAAVGDSIVVLMTPGGNRVERAFARSDIERIEVKPALAPGEHDVAGIAWLLVALVAAAALVPWHYD